MRRLLALALPAITLLVGACSGGDSDAGEGPADAATSGETGSLVEGGPAMAGPRRGGMAAIHDAGSDVECHSPNGAAGRCLTASACTAIADHTSTAGPCPKSGESCCIKTPNVADNPPIPAGYKLMAQSQVTSEMTTWAVAILHDPVTYPLFSTTTRVFGTLTVLARVEWHPPDFQNGVVHRGVTLYVPA